MKFLCAWLLVTSCISAATSADQLRTKRDLVRFQNFLIWLLGFNERNVSDTADSYENDNLGIEEIHVTPNYETIFYRDIPQIKINEDPHVFTEVQYQKLQPVQPTRYMIQHINEPIVFKNYLTQVMQEFPLRDYANEISEHPYIQNRMGDIILRHQTPPRPAVQPVGVKLHQNEVIMPSPELRTVEVNKYRIYNNLPKGQVNLQTFSSQNSYKKSEQILEDDIGGIVTTAKQSLPQPPLYIQNRMRDLIFRHKIPPPPTVQPTGVNLYQDEVVMPSPELRTAEVHKYPLHDSLLKGQVSTLTSTSQNWSKQSAQTLEDDENSFFQINPGRSNNESRKKVKFTSPVHSSYAYKMIYPNQPQKNTVMQMESTYDADILNEKYTTTDIPPISTARIDRTEYLDTLKTMENDVPAGYVFVPPLSTEEPPPGLPKSNTHNVNNISRRSTMPVSSDISKRPIAVSDLQSKNIIHNAPIEQSTSVRQRMFQTTPRENDRGDIPEHSLPR